MLLDFLARLRSGGLTVSTTEYLSLLDSLRHDIGTLSIDDFYLIARLCLIKNEALYDQFDQIFRDYWAGREQVFDLTVDGIPDEWLKLADIPDLTDEQKAQVEALGGWDKLMETLRERLQEQDGEHHGGSRWIGTGGTSPFGHGGFHPEGIRIGGKSRQGRAVKVWEQRRYRDLDGSRELGTRNFKMALRKLRRLARDGRPDSLDLNGTIRATAHNAGLLDIKMEAERRNTVKLLLFLDVGGSMDYHTAICESLFSAVKAEFKRLEYVYFHNFLYERVWQNNDRRHTDTLATNDLMQRFGPDHKVIFVGDATMSPYEIASPGGSVEHWNEEPGALWLQRLQRAFPHSVWLNPEDPDYWSRTPSVRMVHELMHERMYPLTVDGIQSAIDALKTPIRLPSASA